MKLSEAIFMNGMVKAQGFGTLSMYSIDAPCALGGALQSIGQQAFPTLSGGYNKLHEVWPWISQPIDCPVGGCSILHFRHPYVLYVIFHLNDDHEWTRTKIAEWVASVEPPEEVQETSAFVTETCVIY